MSLHPALLLCKIISYILRLTRMRYARDPRNDDPAHSAASTDTAFAPQRTASRNNFRPSRRLSPRGGSTHNTPLGEWRILQPTCRPKDQPTKRPKDHLKIYLKIT